MKKPIIKVNIKLLKQDFEKSGFEVLYDDNNVQFTLKKNGVTFLYSVTQNTWSCSKLRVSGKGVKDLNYVSNNLLFVRQYPNPLKEIKDVYGKMNFFHKFISKYFFVKLMYCFSGDKNKNT